MTELYPTSAIVPAPESVSLFLERCRLGGVSTIDILLRGSETRPSIRGAVSLVEIRLGIRYEGRSDHQSTVLVRPAEYLASTYFDASDTALQDPLGLFPRPNPWERLGKYGLACAEYCASKGFDAEVFLRGPHYKKRGSLLYKVRPADVAIKEGIHLPLLLIA